MPSNFDVIMDAANLPRVSSKKGKTDLVTETDLLSRKVIKSTMRSEFDDHSIMAEESGKGTYTVGLSLDYRSSRWNYKFYSWLPSYGIHRTLP